MVSLTAVLQAGTPPLPLPFAAGSILASWITQPAPPAIFQAPPTSLPLCGGTDYMSPVHRPLKFQRRPMRCRSALGRKASQNRIQRLHPRTPPRRRCPPRATPMTSSPLRKLRTVLGVPFRMIFDRPSFGTTVASGEEVIRQSVQNKRGLLIGTTVPGHSW